MSLVTPSKTVYVTGAGASRDAGYPLQREILPHIYRRVPPRNLAPDEAGKFTRAVAEISEFLESTYGATRRSVDAISLEDVFGVLDNAIREGRGFRKYPPERLRSIRRNLSAAIILLFESRSGRDKQTPVCFGAGLVLRRLASQQDADPFAVISTNWDVSLDSSIAHWANTIADEVVRAREARRDSLRSARVDYCVYDYPLKEGRRAFNHPSTQLKALGYYNIKLLKIHGSFNWLQCPTCGRLYSAFPELERRVRSYNLALAEFVGRLHCRKCADRSQLQSLFVGPAFLKDLSNGHLRQVWQNAVVELSEADRIVFLGYSLPEADHEFRNLLARSVRPDAKILAIQPKRARLRARKDDQPTVERFTSFFGPHRTRVEFVGAHDFVHREFRAEIPRGAAPEAIPDFLGYVSRWRQEQSGQR